MNPYRVLEKKRFGGTLSSEEIEAVVRGAADGSWEDAVLGAFLMAVAIQGLDMSETRELTLAMLESGERWELARSVPGVVDKHSTGGVGDKVSLILGPLLAACDVPVAMLTGRSLGHTGGTADKLEALPGIDLALDRERAVRLIESTGLAIGIATGEIAPADRRLYSLRDRTGTVSSLPLVVSSILSKKLATGTEAIVFDCKTGNGAFFPDPEVAHDLGKALIETTQALGCRATAFVTDMSQPLGRTVGHWIEIEESLACLSGEVDPTTSGTGKAGRSGSLLELTLVLSESAATAAGHEVSRSTLLDALASGRARERFDLWARAQGVDPAWLEDPRCPRAPVEAVIEAQRSGVLAMVETKQLGLLLSEACRPQGSINTSVGAELGPGVGEPVEQGQELVRLYLDRDDEGLVESVAQCFTVLDEGEPPDLVRRQV